MFKHLLLHSTTRRALETIATNPAQGYLFVGPIGSGKHLAAKELAHAWPGARQDNIIELESEDERRIGIQAIHDLRQQISGRLAEDQYRSVLIGSDTTLTHEAQNALLKLLEEPPERTTFVVIAETSSHFLPTVRSRLQTISFPYLSEEVVAEHLESKHGLQPGDAVRAYYIGGKTVGGAIRVMNELETIDRVKAFLASSSYERLVSIIPLVSKRDEFITFAQHAKTIYAALLWQAAKAEDLTLATTLAHKLESACNIIEATDRNGNVRLLTTRFVLEL